MSLWLLALAHAATLNAPGVGGTIQEVVTLAGPGDTVLIAPGTYAEALTLSVPITLDGAGAVTLAPPSVATAALQVHAPTGNTTVAGLTIAPGAGRGILATSDLYLEGCDVSGSATDGGAVSTESAGVLSVSDSVLQGSAGGRGGALFVDGTAVVILADTTLTGSADEGGGIYQQGGTLTLVDVTMEGSDASDGGGAFLDGVTFDGTRLVACDNQAIRGSAITAIGSSGSLSTSALADNGATGSGLYLDGGSWTLDHLTAVEHAGAAIEFGLAVTSATLEHSLFVDNGFALNPGPSASLTHQYNGYGGNVSDGLTPDPTSLTNLDITFQGWPSRCDLSAFLPRHTHTELFDVGTDLDPDGTASTLGVTGGPHADPDLYDDDDGDGLPDVAECDDADPARVPGAEETCDSLDNDCDDLVDAADPDFDGSTRTWWPDVDQDGYGDQNVPAGLEITSCAEVPGHAENGADCDDADPDRNPGEIEQCDDVDWNCDGSTQFGAVDAQAWYPDDDGDGFGASNIAPLVACDPPGVDWVANDRRDCDDENQQVNPSSAEVCNGRDDDCDFTELDAVDIKTWYPDADGDGYPDTTLPTLSCEAPVGTIAARPDGGFDCYDDDALSHSDAVEICDDRDNDCSGRADDLTDDPPRWYADDDGDGFGSDRENAWYDTDCPAEGYVADDTDCDDLDPRVNPAAEEVCNGKDDDCTGTADDRPLTSWYVDLDGDGWGSGEPSELSCGPEGWVEQGGDCADVTPEVNPGAVEVPGNDVDEDCDGERPGSDDASGIKGVEPREGCQCDASPGPAATWLLLPLLAGIRRRERPCDR